MSIKIKKLHIKNFLSLRDVSIAFKPLTILVGPNASGKSNVLRGLKWIRFFMLRDKLPTSKNISEFFWAGDEASNNNLSFNVESECHPNGKSIFIKYHLQLQKEHPRLKSEQLYVNNVEVISIRKGIGKISDEDGKNKIDYSSDKLALKSAGAYGKKPFTKEFSNFIKNWEFYDFMPEIMRRDIINEDNDDEAPSILDEHGAVMRPLLFNWYKKGKDNFQLVNNSLENSLDLSLNIFQAQKKELGLEEGYNKTIPLNRISDGTLRLLAYYTLLNQEKLPLLVAIEESERNLHPAALQKVASLLEELAQKTQVVITTHSSQLLDCFSESSLGDDLGVMLLNNIKGEGTQVLDLETVKKDNAALQGWIDDFGIGSAIFDSGLI